VSRLRREHDDEVRRVRSACDEEVARLRAHARRADDDVKEARARQDDEVRRLRAAHDEESSRLRDAVAAADRRLAEERHASDATVKQLRRQLADLEEALRRMSVDALTRGDDGGVGGVVGGSGGVAVPVPDARTPADTRAPPLDTLELSDGETTQSDRENVPATGGGGKDRHRRRRHSLDSSGSAGGGAAGGRGVREGASVLSIIARERAQLRKAEAFAREQRDVLTKRHKEVQRDKDAWKVQARALSEASQSKSTGGSTQSSKKVLKVRSSVCCCVRDRRPCGCECRRSVSVTFRRSLLSQEVKKTLDQQTASLNSAVCGASLLYVARSPCRSISLPPHLSTPLGIESVSSCCVCGADPTTPQHREVDQGAAPSTAAAGGGDAPPRRVSHALRPVSCPLLSFVRVTTVCAMERRHGRGQ
jgi:hypothetical protein